MYTCVATLANQLPTQVRGKDLPLGGGIFAAPPAKGPTVACTAPIYTFEVSRGGLRKVR